LKAEKFKLQFKRLFAAKGFGLALIGIAAGVILLLMPNGKEEESPLPEITQQLSSAEYCALLEQKAVKLIETLPEVDECAVFITLDSGYQYVYATDQHVREDGEAKETDKTIVLADGEKGESPLLIQETMPKIAGVAVVCGGASYETQYRIIELMCALFNIESNRISVQT